MFTIKQLSVFSFLFTLFAFVSALPLALRDVFVPPVTSPAEGDIWKIGENYTVTWDTSSAPVNITNKGGLLDIENPLAKGFDILQGEVNVTVPDVEPGDDYTVVLFGDSGNNSPQFTITA
ncbi:hypothetical protein BD413DRAFT_152317 [Trametes elegans]|nr:hypothetical protein BD413DRAFT_152317 [Trametes elegans]